MSDQKRHDNQPDQNKTQDDRQSGSGNEPNQEKDKQRQSQRDTEGNDAA